MKFELTFFIFKRVRLAMACTLPGTTQGLKKTTVGLLSQHISA